MVMVGSIDQIAQRLAALDQQIEMLGDAFQETYRGYLKSLGQVVRQQIILSCYHICTEGYPKQFLALPMQARSQFQDSLRDLAVQTEQQMIEGLKSIEAAIEEFNEIDEPDDLEALLSDEDLESPDAIKLSPIEALAEWQEQTERAILKTLKLASSAANQLLQQAEILPKRIPQPILDAAAKAEGNDSFRSEVPLAGTPNLLNLLVEAGEKSPDAEAAKSSTTALMHIVAVNLRLAELEFNDPTLTTWRTKIRELQKQFQAVGREYQKKRREQAIAEAQLAWKSTWTAE